MEPHCNESAPPNSVYAPKVCGGEGGGKTAVATAGGGGDVCGVRFDARVAVLLRHTCEPLVGNDVFLCAAWVVLSGGTWSQVAVFKSAVAAASGSVGAAHGGIRGGYQLLAVFPATGKSRGLRQSRCRN